MYFTARLQRNQELFRDYNERSWKGTKLKSRITLMAFGFVAFDLVALVVYHYFIGPTKDFVIHNTGADTYQQDRAAAGDINRLHRMAKIRQNLMETEVLQAEQFRSSNF